MRHRFECVIVSRVTCVCEDRFSTVYAQSCKKGGLISQRYDNIKYLFTGLIEKCCTQMLRVSHILWTLKEKQFNWGLQTRCLGLTWHQGYKFLETGTKCIFRHPCHTNINALRGGWRIFKWTPFGKFERTHHPHPTYSTTKKHIPTPFFVIFITSQDNFVTVYQVWSPNYQFYLILMRFWKVNKNYENGKRGNFSGISENFQFLSWNWVIFWKYCPFSASFDHLVQIIQQHPPT